MKYANQPNSYGRGHLVGSRFKKARPKVCSDTFFIPDPIRIREIKILLRDPDSANLQPDSILIHHNKKYTNFVNRNLRCEH